MREALHVIDNELVNLPYSATTDEVANLKKLAKKEIYQCPYCQAKLIVKHGEERGLYFSHQHSEACEESRIIDRAEKRYIKQIERESKLHTVLVDIILDELEIKSKINKEMYVSLGYREKNDWKEYPDIYVKLPMKELAISIITNVNPTDDSKLAQQIKKRHEYFLNKGVEPVWFIEKKEQAIEKEKNSIILWDAELSIASKTKEDTKWDILISNEIDDEDFFNYFNYPTTFTHDVDVKSLYYIFNTDEKIVVRVQRFLKDRIMKPFRAFLLNEGYEIPFADALAIEDGFMLSNSEIEEEYRKVFQDKINQKRDEKAEQQRHEEETRKKRLEQEEKERKRNTEEREMILNNLLQQNAIDKIRIELTYNELKRLLKEKISLTQKEQMELWTKFMPKIGLKNSNIVWEIVLNNNCKNFSDLKVHLEKMLL
ncbi:competence protein CoiA family protein [Cytobacillus gottheilii]|uniref:competence protein CoiA family protein n=1 Tax=Cytobacillus gottheilii TaxID=859144 RepID=UPI0009BB00B5|nr:competence protein CoiA family protein [Cytobacillus gottheilii]